MGNKLLEKVSTESIDSQLSGKVVKDLTEQLKQIRKTFKERNLKHEAVYGEPSSYRAIITLGDMIEKHFGFAPRFVYSPASCASAYPTMMPELHNLTDNLGNEDFLREILIHGRENNKVNNREQNIDTFLTSNSASYFYDNMKKIQKYLKTNIVVVDVKKAKILNLPKDIRPVINFNFYKLIEEVELTIVECLAVLLHEIGHIFLYLEEMIKNVDTSILTLDSFRSSLEKYGKEESLKRFALTLTKDEDTIKKLKALDADDDKEKIGLFVLRNKFSKYTKLHSNETKSFSDTEALADIFATRFGLGLELSTALNKLRERDNLFAYSTAKFLTERPLDFTLIIILLTVSGAFVPLIAFYLGTRVGDMLGSVLLGSSNAKATVYDIDVKRVERIKLDCIRQIKYSTLLNKEKKLLIHQADEIEFLLINKNFLQRESSPLCSTLGDLFRKDKVKLTQMDNAIETLQSNSLYLSSKRLEIMEENKT